MDSAICFTQYFVDKQNVRSFGNIFKIKLLKDKNEALYLLNIFEEESLVSALTPSIKEILSTLKCNLRKSCKADFKTNFPYHKNYELRPLNKADIFLKCWNALCEIIPNNIFGNSFNENLFKKIVEGIMHGMKRQYVLFEKYLSRWDYTVQPWSLLDKTICKDILYHILLWIIRNILSAMISLNFYVTTAKLDADENKLHFFWKHHWQSFYDKTVHRMLCAKVIKIYPLYCMSRKYKRHRSQSTKNKLKTYKKYIPKLHLVLKTNNDVRPIVRYKNDILTLADRYKIKDKLNFLKLLTAKPYIKVEDLFGELYINWLRLNQPKLYFIRADLSNAFGSVNREKLISIFKERYHKYEQQEKNCHTLEKNMHQYKRIAGELSKPLLIRAGSMVYEWRKGLVQGYKYSPALSEMYYTYLDEVYFSEHLKKSHNELKLFVRVVDDYLYVTDSLHDANKFLNALSSYDNVNYDKTVVNFPHPKIKYSEEITFLGYCYNTVKMQISRAQNVYTGQMCYKIAFNSSIENIYQFLVTRIGQSSIQINGLLFNFIYNCDIVWDHIFITFCLSANKFCTILALLCNESEMMHLVELYKKKVTVKLSNMMIEMLMKHKPNDFNFFYCINHFRYVSWLALCFCARQTPKCRKLLPRINDELAKSNCVFGKWREHASRIDSNGNCLRPAVREICRRQDLKIKLKTFDGLPKGFQCYNQKFIYNNQ